MRRRVAEVDGDAPSESEETAIAMGEPGAVGVGDTRQATIAMTDSGGSGTFDVNYYY